MFFTRKFVGARMYFLDEFLQPQIVRVGTEKTGFVEFGNGKPYVIQTPHSTVCGKQMFYSIEV